MDWIDELFEKIDGGDTRFKEYLNSMLEHIHLSRMEANQYSNRIAQGDREELIQIATELNDKRPEPTQANYYNQTDILNILKKLS